MTLLLSYRRWWAIIFVGLLVLPFFGHFMGDLPTPVRTRIAPEEQWWRNAAARLDPFINETFGFRGVMLAGNRAYLRVLKSSRSRPVIIGAEKQMFYTGDQNLEKALGTVVDSEGLARLFSVIDDLNARAKAVGAKLVVTSPPSGETVYFDLLPSWARAQKVKPTEYDLLQSAMAERGVTFADLRPALIASREGGRPYRRTDTHWNFRGSLIGLNEVLKAAGRPDLEVSEEKMLGPLEPEISGDLVRLNGDPPSKDDENYRVNDWNGWREHITPIDGIFATPDEHELFPPYAYETGHPGPRVLIYGDSFTQGYWPPFLVDRVSALAWTHHKYCDADLSAVERFKPDIIIYAPTQRSLACKAAPAP
ncbi:hypothetical protein OSH11_20915 [Kaistia dalseonensis]|uniref:AlgX/AlgJ SGNH hydrolase-like domain-containing protein n=1 Tax=Kaistia dalseonensis TaxID=410840 RepID=A0ABU0HBX4_9HYPH|nr:hypothetical protein [Kaistia dalseonensis]MCX5497176.1 hypothetical protein [Kaistia dalseonensis]MDQ0439807.1 hypothetical protein [Kaistia dalseonensis]